MTTTTMYFGTDPGILATVAGAVSAPFVPTHARCVNCSEQFTEDDCGLILPSQLASRVDLGLEYLIGMGAEQELLVGVHCECFLAMTLGHKLKVCECTGWDTRSRDAAREVVRRASGEVSW